MSSRLFVTRVVDKAKVIKHWYAKPARSDISIAELFSQLRDGNIDGRSRGFKKCGTTVVPHFLKPLKNPLNLC